MTTLMTGRSRPALPRARARVGLAPAALATLAALAALPATARAQGLRYTLTPTATQVQWDDALGLDDSYFYGGRLGLVFGRFVELQGHFLTNEGSATRLGDLSRRLGVGDPPPDSRLDVRRYGADIVLNLGNGAITPFARGGGSVLRFAPDGAARSEAIALSYGGGLRFGDPSRVSLNLFADQTLFRVDRTRLLPGTAGAPPAAADPESNEIRRSLAYGAGLTIPLGGGTSVYDDAPALSLFDLSLPVDAFAGALEFDDADGTLDVERQRFVGARTGVDFGPYVGLRGFYWRGVNRDFDRAQRVQSYGGEAQFNLGAGSGFTPFLLAGGGRLDYMRGYAPDSGAGTVAADRDYLILGGGVRLPLGDRVHLQVAARDLLMTGARAELADVASPDDLRHNWQYSAGIGFQLGRRAPAGRSARGRDGRVDTVYVGRAGRAAARRAGEDDRRVRAEPRMERAMERAMAPDTVVVTALGDTLRGEQADSAMRTRRAGAGYQSGRTMTVVVPTEGEITVRYGPPRDSARTGAGATAAPMSGAELREAVRAVIREEIARAMVTPSATGTASNARPMSQPDSLEARIMARVDALLRVRMAEQRDSLRAIVRDEVARQGMGADAERRLMARVEQLVAARLRERAVTATVRDTVRAEPAAAPARRPISLSSAESWSAYTGLAVSGGTQLLLGGRADLGELVPSLPGFDVVPEVALGFGGGGTSLLVAANLAYEFGGFRTTALGQVRPYVSAGLGFVRFTGGVGDRAGLDLVINPAYGASATVPGLDGLRVRGRVPELFVEHQGVGFFDVNRLLVGLKYRR